MKKFSIILSFLISATTAAQQKYKILRLPFNSQVYSEMAPVIFKNGIVYSSNEKSKVISTVDQNSNYNYSLYFAEKKGKGWKKHGLLSKEITSPLNESSATFSPEYEVMYITRSHMAELKLSQIQNLDSIRNGIYRANLKNKNKWEVTNSFPFNSESYDVSFPSLSPDGKSIFFCSRKEGGYGGYDIYKSELINGEWKEPENLGPVINTEENEVFPFYHSGGRLYFSSRGHNSLGGLDIFYSEFINNKWIRPIDLPRPFNSRKDDFSYVISENMDTGYFSSNRRNDNDDIYMFASSFPAFKECEMQVDEKFCYEFAEEGSMDLDTTSLKYEWDFGDGNKKRGIKAIHCFKEIGFYIVSLNVIDTITGEIYFSEATYDLMIEPKEQPIINVADTVFAGEEIKMDGYSSVIRSFEPTDYYWDFGNGNIEFGQEAKNKYSMPGSYYIRLGITSENKKNDKGKEKEISKMCSRKKIVVIKKTND